MACASPPPPPPPIPSSTPKAKAAPTFKAPKNLMPSPTNLENIEPLTGKDNYEDWADVVTTIMQCMGCKEIVIDGAVLPDGATADERDGYDFISNQALLMLLQVISKPILKTVVRRIRVGKEGPHSIWKYLKDQYAPSLRFAYICQLRTVFGLSSSYDSSRPMFEFFDLYDAEWAKLHTLTGALDEEPSLRPLLELDTFKRDTILAILLPHHHDAIYELIARPDFKDATYSVTKLWLSTMQPSAPNLKRKRQTRY